MFSRYSVLFTISLVAALAVFGGCDRGPDLKPVAAAVKTIDERFAVSVGDRTVQMQVAVTPEEMERGLMFRKTMGPDEGMLFIYATPTQMNFWMRNCDIPLDIGFFDGAAELKEIYPMYPHDEKTVSSHSHNLRFALEMNQGWYERSGVRAGAKLDLKAVAEAVRARGIKPDTLGLAP